MIYSLIKWMQNKWDFITSVAGAEIITTGSYQSSVEGYMAYLGVDEDEALDLMRDSVKLAKGGIRMAEVDTGE